MEKLIKIKDVLDLTGEKEGKYPKPFHIVFFTTKGERIELKRAVRVKVRQGVNTKTHIGVKVPNAHHPYTVNIRLITQFNNTSVSL